MPHSVTHPGPGSKYAIERCPYHTAHCRALSTAMWGYAATVSRLTGISERVLQFFMAPQGDKEGPFEKGARILRALRELGAPAWSEPIVALCDEFGGDFVLRPVEPAEVEPNVALAGVMERTAGVIQEHSRAAADGVVTPEERRRLRDTSAELRAALDRFDKSLDATAGPRAVGGATK